ncbi:MAG TPA: quinoprotein dehydrogenase-associated putative ABC transporter substrate-binding protein [Steroidobacteraceae bacterium]
MAARPLHSAIVALTLTGMWAGSMSPAAQARHELVVCADPNNLPFSSRDGSGFENQLAELVARKMDVRLRYVWWAQRRGFVRNTLTEARCELWPGVAADLDRVLTTQPYYRSTYVFVTRAASKLDGLTLNDSRLKTVSVGVQMIGNDAMNTPPAHALARRGVVQNVRGYSVYGDYSHPNPPARIVDAVARGEIDVGLVWGPLAGYFASRTPIRLRVEPVTPAIDDGVVPMTYAISMGVSRTEPQLRARVNEILRTEAPAIGRILDAYHVPRLALAAGATLRPASAPEQKRGRSVRGP